MLQKAHEAVVGSRTFDIVIGTRIQLQFGRKGQEFKAAGVLVGMIPHEFLIIRIPTIPGILGRLDEDALIIARYVYAGNVYGFSSTMLFYIHKPALLVFVTCPATVETVNLRKTHRIECRFPAMLKTDLGDYKAVMVDMSLGGCRICIDNGATESSSFNVNRMIGLSFYLAGIAKEQVINGKVKNLKKDDQLSEMGIQFDQENKAVLNDVKLYIDSFATLQFFPLINPLPEHA